MADYNHLNIIVIVIIIIIISSSSIIKLVIRVIKTHIYIRTIAITA